jgi:hypothetical protein
MLCPNVTVGVQVEMSQRMEKREKLRRDLLADTAGGDMSSEREEMLQKRAYAQVLKEQVAEGKIEDDIDKITTYVDPLPHVCHMHTMRLLCGCRAL